MFWPAPNVDSGLVRLIRRPEPPAPQVAPPCSRVVDAAFAQRRKTLRAALAGLGRVGGRPPSATARRSASTREPVASSWGVAAFVRSPMRGLPRRSRVGWPPCQVSRTADSVSVRAPAKINLRPVGRRRGARRLPPAGHRLPRRHPLRRGPRRRLRRTTASRVTVDRRPPGRRPARRHATWPCGPPGSWRAVAGSTAASHLLLHKGNPGRRRDGRRLGRRRRGAGRLRRRCGAPASTANELLELAAELGSDVAVRAARRDGDRHRARRAAHAGAGPGPVPLGARRCAERRAVDPRRLRGVRPAATGRRALAESRGSTTA